jgi:hypothetical protein
LLKFVISIEELTALVVQWGYIRKFDDFIFQDPVGGFEVIDFLIFIFEGFDFDLESFDVGRIVPVFLFLYF